MESASQWVSQMGRLFFADEYVRHTADTYTTKQSPRQEAALRVVREVLPELELRVIEFLSEWMVSLLMPAKHLLETRSPHLSFMLGKESGSANYTLASKLLRPSIVMNRPRKPSTDRSAVSLLTLNPRAPMLHGM
jgi:hypothetical protein